jgi:hypothetical protein
MNDEQRKEAARRLAERQRACRESDGREVARASDPPHAQEGGKGQISESCAAGGRGEKMKVELVLLAIAVSALAVIGLKYRSIHDASTLIGYGSRSKASSRGTSNQALAGVSGYGAVSGGTLFARVAFAIGNPIA